METNLSSVITTLEKEKCSFHKYRAMVFADNGELKVIGCCKSFEKFLEAKAREMMQPASYQIGKLRQ